MKRLIALLLPFAFVAACKDPHPGAGLVPTEAGAVTQVSADAAPVTVDINTCTGCALIPSQSWSFQGIYSDDKCTVPVAQLDAPACLPIPTLGANSITYNDAIGGRKANETANITLTDQIAPDAAHFRQAAHGCVRANEQATPITPMNCSGQRICRDANGVLGCANCRTLTGGCPDMEETRLYASITDPAIKGAVAPGGNANLEKLRECCNAMAAQARSMGATPEAGMLASYAAQCLVIVSQAGPNGTAPELGPLRGFLTTGKVPAVCKGL